MKSGKNTKKYWLDTPRNVTVLVYVLAAVCAGIALADLFHAKQVHYPFESFPFFHAAFGFVAFSLIVLSGRPLRKLLMRKEDYYDR